MKIIGITGPTGAGKSLLCRGLLKMGIPCVDADEVYHSLLTPPSECLDAIRRTFGGDVFGADGKLDRAALGTIVFGDAKKLGTLNKTVLKYVISEIEKIAAEHKRRGASVIAVDAPTLIESGFNKKCDLVISVIAPKELRHRRIVERDCLTDEAATSRISAQKSDEFYRESSDLVLVNDGDEATLERSIEEIIKKSGFATGRRAICEE